MRSTGRVAPHHDELDEIQRRFATVPLFDTGLASELDALEQQRQSLTQSRHQHFLGDTRGSTPLVGRSISPALRAAGDSRSPSATVRVNSGAVGHYYHHNPSTPSHLFHPSHSGGTYVMPPPPKRPWSFEQLLRAGHSIAEAQLLDDSAEQGPRDAAISGRAASSKRRGGAAGCEADPEPDARSEARGGQPSPTMEEGTARRHRRHRHHHRETDASHHRRRARTPRGGSHYSERGQGALPLPSSSSSSDIGATESGGVIAVLRREHARAAREDAAAEQATGPMSSIAATAEAVDEADDIGPAFDRKLSSEKMDIHIERAALRRTLQQERLRSVGEQAPGTKVEGGCQTDDFLFSPPHSAAAATSSLTSSTWNSRYFRGRCTSAAAATEPTRQRETAMGLSVSGAPAFKTPPAAGVARSEEEEEERQPQLSFATAACPASSAAATASGGLLLRPSVDYKPVELESFQQRRIQELAKRYGGSSHDGMGAQTGMSRSGTSPLAATAPAAASREGASAVQPQASEARGSLANDSRPDAFSSKGAIMEQLDQLQLANEELLVRNKALERPSVLTPDDNSRRAAFMAHVGAANKQPTSAPIAPPLGGYGSFSDGTHSRSTPPEEEETARWQIAHMRNTARGASDAADGEPLRKWAAANLSITSPRTGGSFSGSGGAARQTPGKSSLRQEAYNARKKWGNVTFALPQETTGSRFLEDLSGSAKSMMFVE